jgi:hypothetical protein
MTHLGAPICEPLAAARRRGRRYRLGANAILVLGLGGAALVYCLGSRPPDFSDDPAMVGFNRAADRQMSVLYGKQGQLIEDLNDSLKQPGTQALLIVAVAVVAAIGCFQFARLVEAEARANEPAANEHAVVPKP